MTVARLTYDLCLTVRSPFLFSGLAQSALGVDSAALRDVQKRPIIPADQVRGIFKDMLQELPDNVVPNDSGLEIDDLFGRESSTETPNNVPQRRRIHFTDLTDHCPQHKDKSYQHTRIEINDTTGSVETGALQVIELVAPMGAEVTFSGSIQVMAQRDKADSIRKLLNKALALIGSIGSVKSGGFGEVIPSASTVTWDSAKTVDLPSSLASGAQPWPHGDRLTLAVAFDRPVLFNSQWLAENSISSALVIPGAAFKGALADSLSLGLGASFKDAALTQALTALHFSHAYPVDQDGHPLGHFLPQSLMAVKKGEDILYGDAVYGPLGSGAMIGGEPALNIGDWKWPWFEGVKTALGWSTADEPPTMARTHTAINPKTGSALSEKLFTTHLRSETDADGRKYAWHLTVDLGKVPAGASRSQAEAMIALLLRQGLSGMGGTGATATFQKVASNLAPPQGPPGDDVCLRLLTPAVMCHANDIWPDEETELPALDVYAAYFRALHPGLSLKAAFAQQKLAGGYQARRRRAYGDDVYFPFVVTQPGAVFLLNCDTPEARDAVLGFARWGLPPAPYQGDTFVNMTWENCPYMPENGFGAVAMDDLSTPARQALIEGVEHV